MIIQCINCSKKFEVKSELIPDEGRTIQCGSCNHVWFFKKNNQTIKEQNNKNLENLSIKKTKKESKKDIIKSTKKNHNKGSEIVKYTPKSYFSFSRFLSYIIVIIISFIAIIIILDTFKNPLYKFFPNLEFILFSLFEILKDINLFIKDLI